MTWKTLGDPTPLSEPLIYDPINWPSSVATQLFVPTELPDTPLTHIIQKRRSGREFGQLDSELLGDLLWLTSVQHQSGHSEYGFPLSLRPCPSAGAIHPIHLLFSNRINRTWIRYDPTTHSLQNTGVDSSSAIDEANNVLPLQNGHLILFAAEHGKTYAKYSYSDSLIWRDAGVILANLALGAELLNLNFCPLGVTGDKWAQSLDEQGRLAGVGMAVIGSR